MGKVKAFLRTRNWRGGLWGGMVYALLSVLIDGLLGGVWRLDAMALVLRCAGSVVLLSLLLPARRVGEK